MNRRDQDAKLTTDDSRKALEETLEPELREALGNFKSSVTAWSEAMMSRPREAKAPARTNWALGGEVGAGMRRVCGHGIGRGVSEPSAGRGGQGGGSSRSRTRDRAAA